MIKKMKCITEPLKSAVITIGNFDGVHIGHQALISRTIKEARKIRGTSVVITFEPHPAQVINSKKKNLRLITPYKERNKLIKNLGIDILICIPFTKEFALISARNFVKELLVKQIGMTVIVIGKDYNFGKNRIGNIESLKKYAKEFKFDVIIEKLILSPKIENIRVSSTIIRNMVEKGKIEKAKEILGRSYSMQGKVIQGKGKGKLLGFPTANINPENDLYPKLGTYAVFVKYKNEIYSGVANIGYNPTFRNHFISIEVHILNFDKNIYGDKIKINFVKRLRAETKFANASELASQIQKDIERAKKEIPLAT